jgi:transposase-like protein
MTVRRHRRYSTDFKIQLVQGYLDGVGSIGAIANQHGVPHSLLPIWIRKLEAGELAEEVHLQEQVREYQARIVGLERKVGQLTMELDALKKRAQIRPRQTDGIPSIISGPEASPSNGGANS